MTRIFGIPNCDSVKKARQWLAQHARTYEFIDLVANPPPLEQLNTWLERLGAETLINRRSTTWRQLSALQQEHVFGPEAAVLLQAYPTLIKRPLVEHQGQLWVGFSADQFAHYFS
jgi:arsenate reductase (glutaredoxin)